RIEVADDAHDDVVRVHVLLVKGGQVFAGDGVNRVVFRLAAVRIVGAVSDARRKPVHDGAHLVVAARNAALHARFGQVDLVLAEGGIAQQLDGELEDVFEILLQAGKRNRGGDRAGGGLDARGARFELVVHLVAGQARGAALPPRRAVDVHHAGLRVGDLGVAAADADGAVNQRQ